MDWQLLQVPLLAFLFGGLMKISDLMSTEHGLRLTDKAWLTQIFKAFFGILVGLVLLLIFSFDTYIGWIFLFYIISFSLRGKIDDFNHLITTLVIVAGLIYGAQSGLIQWLPSEEEIVVFGVLFMFFLIFPTLFGKIHDRRINKLRLEGKRRDIKNRSRNDGEIDLYMVMKSEIPHSFYVYLLPALVFYLTCVWLCTERKYTDILVLTSIAFFISAYELIRYVGTRRLKKEREENGK